MQNNKMGNHNTKIMGIINANTDSFYSKSRFLGNNALKEIKTMINNGANIIDIGAVSSRPGSLLVNKREELKRVQPICDLIYEQKLYKDTIFSIDSYEPSVIKYALDRGFKIVNDITGLHNDEVAQITSAYGATIIIMHMQNKPYNMQDQPKYNDIIMDISNFFDKQIKKANEFGIKDIILDVGIGFGKTLEHNLTLLKNLKYFNKFGFELLVGASRKSIINDIISSPIHERLPGTLAIHLDSIRRGATIIRCHDVQEHYQAIKVQERLLSL